MHSWRCVHFFIFLRVLTLECHHLQYSGRLIKNGDYNETVINLKRGNRIPSKKRKYISVARFIEFIYLSCFRNLLQAEFHYKVRPYGILLNLIFFSPSNPFHKRFNFIYQPITSKKRKQKCRFEKNKLRLYTISPINQIIKYSATGQ